MLPHLIRGPDWLADSRRPLAILIVYAYSSLYTYIHNTIDNKSIIERSKETWKNYELALSSLREVNRAFDLVYGRDRDKIKIWFFEQHTYSTICDLYLTFWRALVKSSDIITAIIIVMSWGITVKKKDNWKARSKSLFVRTLIHA